MSDFNRITVLGHLTRDPELRYTQSEKAVAKFTVAANNARNKEETLYITCIAWDKLGEIANTYLKKGSHVFVDGRLVIRDYEDRDGIKRKAVEIVLTDMRMLGSRPDAATAAGGHANGGQSAQLDEAIDDDFEGAIGEPDSP